MRVYIFIVLALLITGCLTINKSVQRYMDVYEQIKLGDTKEKVLNLLEPIQKELHISQRKASERFSHDGYIYDIYYARSAWVPDNSTTDDEFTPYIFKDGILIAIGWDFLGGPKRTSADVAREIYEIERAKASAPKIETNVEQNTNVNKGGRPSLENLFMPKPLP